MFSIVLFRHLPELGPDTDVVLMARRGVLMVITLFALFCFTLELERLGMHLARTNESSACGSTALSTEVCRRLSPLLPGRRDYCQFPPVLRRDQGSRAERREVTVLCDRPL